MDGDPGDEQAGEHEAPNRPDTIEVTTRARARARGPGESVEEIKARILGRFPSSAAGTRLGKPRIHLLRVATARERILRVLERRVVCYSRELERQVCEVGFNFATARPSDKPEPVHYSEAMKQLTRPDADEEGGMVSPDVVALRFEIEPGQPVTFYALAWADETTLREALDRKVAAVRAFLRVEHVPAISGWHAEEVHHAAMLASSDWFSVGWKGGADIRRLHGRSLSTGSIDLAGVHRPTGIAVAAEVKNRREWFYETDEVVWALLGAAAELEAVPVLIARRVPEPLFKFMKGIGGVAFPATKLILPPEAETMGVDGEPNFAEATLELGFHSDNDYLSVDGALPRHRALWDRILPGQIEARHARFLALQEDILRIAFAENLRQKGQRSKSGRTRPALIRELLQKAHGMDEAEKKDDEAGA